MRKNLYKYAALAVIVEELAAKADSMRTDAKETLSYYSEEVPEYVKAETEKKMAIADEIDLFISKL